MPTGPIPKPRSLLRRKNKASTKATLHAEENKQEGVPELKPRDDGQPWHPNVIEWWQIIWESPMAPEYLKADRSSGLYVLADMYHLRWQPNVRNDVRLLVKIAAEIRQYEVRFGLSPIDRRRLQWEIEKGETAAAKTKMRKEREAPKPEAQDPRDVLKAVS